VIDQREDIKQRLWPGYRQLSIHTAPRQCHSQRLHALNEEIKNKKMVHASSFLHLFQIRFFDDSVFRISISFLFHQSFDFAHIRCLNMNNFTVFLMHLIKQMTFASKLVILCILTIILSFVFCKCSSKSFQLTFCRLYDAFSEFSINFTFFVTIVNKITS